MMRKIFNTIIIFITLFILYNVLIEKVLVYDSVNYGLKIWVQNLIPTLFPFFIISDILINFNLISYIPKTIRNIFKYLFNITDNMFTVLILSVLSGFPSNAKNVRTLYDRSIISLDEANHILIFSHFPNPLFVLTTVGIFFLNNKTIGIILLCSLYISNLLLALLFRKYFKHSDYNNTNIKINKVFFGDILISSIKKAIDTILLICGILVIFMLISSIINHTFNFNSYNSMIIKGILEMTIGLEMLGTLNLSIIHKVIIASCFLSFSGLSVHMQIFSQLTGTNIKYRYFFIGRIFQMILSAIVSYILFLIVGI